MGTHDEITEEYFADSQVQVRIIRNTLLIYNSRSGSLMLQIHFPITVDQGQIGF